MKLRVMLAVAAVVVTSACSSFNSSAPLAPSAQESLAQTRSSPHAARAACPATILYVVSAQLATIEIYDPKRLHAGPCGSITGFGQPRGLFVDGGGNLWVADSSTQSVYEFAPGGGTPSRTLSDPDGVPNDVAVDAASGTVYVTEYQNNVSPTTLAEVYAQGSASPTASLGDPNARNGGFAALDNRGNLYVSFMATDNTAHVDRWKGGTGDPVDLRLKLISDGGIATTSRGALAACDPFAYRCGIFELGSRRMTHVFGHMGRRQRGNVADKPPWLHPDALALDQSERHAFVVAESLTAWDFPGPKHRPNQLPRVEIKVPGVAGVGIAVSPAAAPGKPYR